MGTKKLIESGIITIIMLVNIGYPQTLFPANFYQFDLTQIDQSEVVQQFNNTFVNVMKSNDLSNKTQLIKSLFGYLNDQEGNPQSLIEIQQISDIYRRAQELDRWFIYASPEVGNYAKNFAAEVLCWRKTAVGSYREPDVSAATKELAIKILCKLKPEGYLDILKNYASHPDTISQGKYIMMSYLRKQWDCKETYNILKNTCLNDPNPQVQSSAKREITRYLNSL